MNWEKASRLYPILSEIAQLSPQMGVWTKGVFSEGSNPNSNPKKNSDAPLFILMLETTKRLANQTVISGFASSKAINPGLTEEKAVEALAWAQKLEKTLKEKGMLWNFGIGI